MSDTTAFLSGCAIAAVATFILLDRGNNFDKSPNPCVIPHQNNIPSVTETVPPVPTPSYPPGSDLPPPLNNQLEQQRVATEQLTAQLEQQRLETQQLKAQLEQQQIEYQQSILQLQQQALPKSSSEESASTQTVLLWVVGGVALFLILGGGIILVIMVISLSMQLQQQSHRTTHVVHPIDMRSPRRISGRPARVFAPAPKIRRTEYIEEE